jgi:cytochrome b
VALTHRAGDVILEVTDQGGSWQPDAGTDDHSGRGLLIVATLARAWGITGDETARIVWAELSCQ